MAFETRFQTVEDLCLSIEATFDRALGLTGFVVFAGLLAAVKFSAVPGLRALPAEICYYGLSLFC